MLLDIPHSFTPLAVPETSMIKAVFFDLSDTLCDYQTASAAAIDRACEYAVAHSEALTSSGLREAYLREARHAADESRRWVASRFVPGAGVDQQNYRLWERALEKCGVANAILAHAVALQYQLTRMRTLQLFSDGLPAVQALQGRVSIGLVAEGAAGIVNEELTLLGLRGLFSVTAIEGEVGCAKRDPQIFAYAVRKVGCEPSQAAHVGDSLESDIVPAHRAGLTTVWINRTDEPPPDDDDANPDHTVADLALVPDLMLGLP